MIVLDTRGIDFSILASRMFWDEIVDTMIQCSMDDDSGDTGAAGLCCNHYGTLSQMGNHTDVLQGVHETFVEYWENLNMPGDTTYASACVDAIPGVLTWYAVSFCFAASFFSDVLG